MWETACSETRNSGTILKTEISKLLPKKRKNKKPFSGKRPYYTGGACRVSEEDSIKKVTMRSKKKAELWVGKKEKTTTSGIE